MGAGVWKLHHPCFLVFFAYCRVCGGFQLHSGSYFPFGSGDIFFVLCNDFYAFLHNGIYRNNRPVL